MNSVPKVPLAQIATTCAGGTPSRARKDYFGGDIPWVKSGEVDSPRIIQTQESLSASGLDASAAQLLPPGTTLVALYGATAGKVGRLGVTAATNQAVLAVRAKDPDESDYLYYAVEYAAPCLLRRLQGGAQPNLSGQMVRELELPWPDKNRRGQLVTLASSFDAALTAAAGVLAAKCELRRIVMQELLTGRRRFPGFGPNGDGIVPPAGWRAALLTEAMDIRFSSVDKKSSLTETPVRLCNYMDVWRHDYIDDDMPFMNATAATIEVDRFALREGDVLLTKDSETREDIASTACVRSAGANLVAGYHLALLRPRPEVAAGGFVAKQLMLPLFHRHFVRAATGATRYGLSLKAIREATVWVPSVAEQRRVYRALEQSDQEISLTTSLLHALKSQRKEAVRRFFRA